MNWKRFLLELLPRLYTSYKENRNKKRRDMKSIKARINKDNQRIDDYLDGLDSDD